MIPFGWESIEEQHSQCIVGIVDSHCFESFNIGIETTHFCTGMLHSTEAELDHGLEVSEKSRDSSCTKGVSQGSPGFCTGICNQVADIVQKVQLNVAICHTVGQSPGSESLGVGGSHSGPVDYQPEPSAPEICLHLGSPFSIVCPIEDGDMGRNGGVVRRRHFLCKKKSVLMLNHDT